MVKRGEEEEGGGEENDHSLEEVNQEETMQGWPDGGFSERQRLSL